eukprot:TRINITY_DN21096_c0_g1_i1.p3 TRINITY_DN21096_c0_g1~~TRINITY_DN21096_c0_g1_i1.p3  ORF type:complete len:109 (+),score=16.29 TRINITY_DN21096_c0_g1_i1:178-504(+)
MPQDCQGLQLQPQMHQVPGIWSRVAQALGQGLTLVVLIASTSSTRVPGRLAASDPIIDRGSQVSVASPPWGHLTTDVAGNAAANPVVRTRPGSPGRTPPTPPHGNASK